MIFSRRRQAAAPPGPTLPSCDPAEILAALPEPVLVVGRDFRIWLVNFEAQQFFDAGEAALIGHLLIEIVPPDSPIVSLVERVLQQSRSMSESEVTLETPRIGRRIVNVTAGPMGADPTDSIVLVLHEISIARRIDNQLTHRNAARSVSAMAAMLAHEVKNPLSGIRGAAQLLELSAPEEDRQLTRLICDEADRIVALVDRMDAFADVGAFDRAPVNVHAVLEHVRRIAQSGFARHVRFVERYDPSLPPVLGNRDLLVQALLNLVKNAAEAAPETGGEIVISTSYQRGVSIVVPGTDRRVNLPLQIAIHDNGTGIPDDLKDHLFDPFVTTKVNGTGLGLALVAKIVGDHGGVIGFESNPVRGTTFKVSLPISDSLVVSGGTALGLRTATEIV